MKALAILGSTGSIGTQTLEVVRQHKERLEVRVLTAGSNAQLLIEQALEFKPDAVVIADENQYEKVVTALQDTDVKVYTGAQALCDVVQLPSIDIVVTAMVGFVGLRPTIAAIEAKKTIALANKETLVVAGELISHLVVENKVRILPVDSEHSAIFQSLVGEGDNTIDKILLTASGGPFRRFTSEQLQNVTVADALKHPNWSMGAKITIDSATLMNKGLEMIEAKWLFGVQPSQIEVVLHPESIIHSAVQFLDGSIKAQLAMPTMCLPILYALSYPERWEFEAERLDFFKLGAMTFEQADTERFPCLRLAYEAIEQGGTMPCIMNAANEIANELFRQGRISFMAIPQIIEETMIRHTVDHTVSLESYLAADLSARSLAQSIADTIS